MKSQEEFSESCTWSNVNDDNECMIHTRKEWDKSKVGAYVQELRKSGIEVKVAKELNAKELNAKVVAYAKSFAEEHSLTRFEVTVEALNSGTEKREHWDFLMKLNGVVFGKIEYESGAKQYKWVNSLVDVRSFWTRGLSILGRKVYATQQYDIFLKTNMAINSFFACKTEWLLNQIESGAITFGESRHCLDFKTDNSFYSIPWKIVDQKRASDDLNFCADDWDRLCRMICDLAMVRGSQADKGA